MLLFLVPLVWILLNQHRGVSLKNGLFATLISVVAILASTVISSMLG